jgi:hypothetical protein
LPRREKFCNDFTAVGHRHALAGPNFPNILAQTILEFSKPHAFHHFNVASWSYIVDLKFIRGKKMDGIEGAARARVARECGARVYGN